MTYVSKEVPTGSVNGSNKVFTWLNTPTQFDDLWVDGAIYTSYVLVGNVMTLTDAPTLSIFGDYTYGVSQSTADTQETFGDIKAEVWALLGQKSTSTTFSDSRVGKRVNSVIREVLKGRVVSLLSPNQVFRCGRIRFMEGDLVFRAKGGGSVGADFSAGATSIPCVTSFLLPSGYVSINGDLIKYTGTDANGLTGCTGAQMAHFSGERIAQLYAMPGDFEKPNKVLWQMVGSSSSMEIPYDPDNLAFRRWDVTYVPSDDVWLMDVKNVSDNDIVTVDYVKRFDDLASDATYSPLPQSYGTSVIAPLAAGELGFEKLMQISPNALTRAYAKLRSMYGDFGNVKNVTNQGIKAKTYSLR